MDHKETEKNLGTMITHLRQEAEEISSEDICMQVWTAYLVTVISASNHENTIIILPLDGGGLRWGWTWCAFPLTPAFWQALSLQGRG